jgi:drug/metabolite transporter (DMT)-like permease
MRAIIESLKNNKTGIILILITSLMTSIGQLFWKLGQTGDNNWLYIIVGFGFYGIGTILMILAFRYGSFSVLHPLLAFGYIFGLIWAKVFLNEVISISQGLGIGVIIIAVILIGGGDE